MRLKSPEVSAASFLAQSRRPSRTVAASWGDCSSQAVNAAPARVLARRSCSPSDSLPPPASLTRSGFWGRPSAAGRRTSA
ncbi:hypothetical protein [Thermocatellispora tengchongensis]|uniref:hypothetical protein n=1 Tax=Thermocatellispora tengchongensis TaxID=1073253 RepID=UPI00363C70E3